MELTIFEHVNGRTFPCRVRDPREWAAALDAAERVAPEALAGLLEWECRRCGDLCEADLVTLSPLRFSRPALHHCAPTGLRRLAAVWRGVGVDARAFVPELPALPVTYA